MEGTQIRPATWPGQSDSTVACQTNNAHDRVDTQRRGPKRIVPHSAENDGLSTERRIKRDRAAGADVHYGLTQRARADVVGVQHGDQAGADDHAEGAGVAVAARVGGGAGHGVRARREGGTGGRHAVDDRIGIAEIHGSDGEGNGRGGSTRGRHRREVRRTDELRWQIVADMDQVGLRTGITKGVRGGGDQGMRAKTERGIERQFAEAGRPPGGHIVGLHGNAIEEPDDAERLSVGVGDGVGENAGGGVAHTRGQRQQAWRAGDGKVGKNPARAAFERAVVGVGREVAGLGAGRFVQRVIRDEARFRAGETALVVGGDVRTAARALPDAEFCQQPAEGDAIVATEQQVRVDVGEGTGVIFLVFEQAVAIDARLVLAHAGDEREVLPGRNGLGREGVGGTSVAAGVAEIPVEASIVPRHMGLD